MTKQEYMKQVARHLRCPATGKKEIEKQLDSHIETAMEEGRSLDEILTEMGSPETLAEEFNDSFEEEKEKKKTGKYRRLGVICGAVLLVLAVGAGILYWVLPKEKDIYDSKIFDAASIQERTEEVIRAFSLGDYETFDSYLSPEVRELLNETPPETVKAYIGENWGEFRSLGNLYMTEVRQMGMSYAVVQVNTSYENVSVTYTLSYNEEMELYGFYVK